MKLNELIKNNEILSIDGDINCEINNITTDACEITQDTLFVFLRSSSFDINKIKEFVISKNPSAIVCDNELILSKTNITVIRVADTRKLLPFLFIRIYRIDPKKLRLCAVTGTNGKTSTAYMLQRILMYAGYKVGFIGTGKIAINETALNEKNYSMTTPDPKLLYSALYEMSKNECDYIVMEVSSHALYFDKVLPLYFLVSIFTNLSEEHLDFHKTMEEYFKTKLKILDQSEIGIFNIDDKYSKIAYREETGERPVGSSPRQALLRSV